MSRRRPDSRDGGTDSFLDVLANLVGILVILVVLTALRAGTAAATKTPAPPAEPVAATPPPKPPRRPLVAPRPNVIYERTPTSVVPPELLAEEAALRADLAAMRREEEEAASVADQTRTAMRTALAKRDVMRRERAVLLAAAESSRRSEADADAATEVARAERGKWEAALAEEVERPPVPLEHVTLPEGRVVTGTEIHFRLLEPLSPSDPVRVRAVPVNALTDLLKEDIERRKPQIARRGGYVGTVGPVRGHTLTYTIGDGSEVIRNRFRGQTPGRLRLTGWELAAGPNAVAESAAEAVVPGSLFTRSLRSAGPGATATFWVEPGAFGAYRGLRDAARAAGFTVAARPLPADKPISASPRGTRSVAQ